MNHFMNLDLYERWNNVRDDILLPHWHCPRCHATWNFPLLCPPPSHWPHYSHSVTVLMRAQSLAWMAQPYRLSFILCYWLKNSMWPDDPSDFECNRIQSFYDGFGMTDVLTGLTTWWPRVSSTVMMLCLCLRSFTYECLAFKRMLCW